MSITTLFTDIGEVLLNNGWDIDERELAIQKFRLQKYDFNQRHHIESDTLELGKQTLAEYLDKVIFYKKRTFSQKEFQDFMLSLSKPYNKMIELEKHLKEKYNLKIFALSNESRELNENRILKFGLDSFIDGFISSCYVHLRKPDKDIFKLALDISQSKPSETLFIDDQIIYIEVAKSFGINTIHHTDYYSTVQKLSFLGLIPEEASNNK